MLVNPKDSNLAARSQMKNRLEICSNSCYSIARKPPNNLIIKGTKGLNRHFSQKKKKKKKNCLLKKKKKKRPSTKMFKEEQVFGQES